MQKVTGSTPVTSTSPVFRAFLFNTVCFSKYAACKLIPPLLPFPPNIYNLTLNRSSMYRILLPALLFIVQSVMGQSKYNFFTLGTSQGLSNDNIWSVNQDKNGFIWI